MWTRLRRLIWQWHVVLVTAPTIAGLVILVRLIGVLQTLEGAMYDQYFNWRPPEPHDDRILIVQITEEDLGRYNWPISDEILAQLINKISQQQPRGIGLDLYRNLPVEPGYQALKQTFETTPNLIGIEKVVGRVDTSPIAPAALLHELNQVGSNDAVLDFDGKLRRALLYLDDDSQPNGVMLSFSLRLAILYLQPEGIEPISTRTGAIALGQAEFTPFQPNDGAYIRADDQGFQILLNYRGPRGHFRRVSVSEVLDNRIPADLMRDRIVLIGSTAESVSDYYHTPFSVRLDKNLPQLMAGVEITANLISELLSAALDSRPAIRTWTNPAEWLWIFVWSTVGTVISWQQHTGSRPMRTQWIRTSLSILLASSALVTVSYLAFIQNWWIPVVPPLLALLGSSVVVTGYIAQLATEMRRTFGRYLTDEVVTSLLETPTGLQLGGEKRKITMLMSDLRGFSAISERLPPERVVTLLNLYLETMTEIIAEYGGLINQVIGDGLVIFFGALNQKSDDAERAVACAIAMQIAMEPINQRNQALGLPTIEMGIGINTDEVIVGNIGSLKHAQFTAIGSGVNLAARIESSSVGGQVLVSQAVVNEVSNLIIRHQIEARLKGMQSPITFYEVSGISGTYNLFLPDLQSHLMVLRDEIPIQYMLVEDKQLVGSPIIGSLTKVSRRGAEIRSEGAIAPLSNIRIMLLTAPDNSVTAEDIYAKVTDVSPGAVSSFCIHFTNISPRMVHNLLNLVIEQSKLTSLTNKSLANRKPQKGD